MRAISVSKPGGPEVLQIVEREKPHYGPEEVLVKVEAFGINRADIIQRKGFYPAPAGVVADVPGLEFAGTVEAIGERVTATKPGARVFGLLGGGGYQQYVTVHELLTMPVPADLKIEEAAAYPEAFVTAFDALVLQGGLRPQERVLISAVGSGVGLAAAQIALAYGASVVGTSRAEKKLEQAKSLLKGDFEPILCSSKELNFAEIINKGTGPIDLSIELVGGDYVNEDLKCANVKGRIILVGLLAGSKGALDLSLLLRKRVKITGTTLRARSLDEKIAVCRAFTQEIIPLIARGSLHANIDKVFKAEQIAEAHKMMEEDANFGKIVVRW